MAGGNNIQKSVIWNQLDISTLCYLAWCGNSAIVTVQKVPAELNWTEKWILKYEDLKITQSKNPSDYFAISYFQLN